MAERHRTVQAQWQRHRRNLPSLLAPFLAPGLLIHSAVRRLLSTLIALSLLGASAALAAPLPNAAVERAVHAHAAVGDHDLSVGAAKRLELGDTLTRHGVNADVEVRQITLLEDGKPLTGLDHLLHVNRTVALAEGDDGQVDLLADRKGVKTPRESAHPSLRYGWKSVRQSRFAKGAMVADGLMYTGLAVTALFIPHLVATAAVANVVESVAEKAAYGVSLWRAQPKLRAQHDAVNEVAGFLKTEQAAGRTVDFSGLYARYSKAIAENPLVAPVERLDAFELRDWLTKAVASDDQ